MVRCLSWQALPGFFTSQNPVIPHMYVGWGSHVFSPETHWSHWSSLKVGQVSNSSHKSTASSKVNQRHVGSSWQCFKHALASSWRVMSKMGLFKHWPSTKHWSSATAELVINDKQMMFRNVLNMFLKLSRSRLMLSFNCLFSAYHLSQAGIALLQQQWLQYILPRW